MYEWYGDDTREARMKRTLEFVETTAGQWLAICLSIVILMLGVCGGIALIMLADGDSWAEICVAQGGEYKEMLNPAGMDDEICEMP